VSSDAMLGLCMQRNDFVIHVLLNLAAV